MQLQTETKPGAATLEQQLEAARATLERLQEAVIDTQAESERWRIAFEREPTAQAHAEMVVAQQRAVNAATLVDKHRTETLQPLEAAISRERRKVIMVELEAEQARAEEAFRTAARAVLLAAEQLDAAMAGLGSVQVRRTAAKPEGLMLPPATLDHFVSVANEVLEPLRRHQEQNTTWAQLGVRGSAIVLTLSRPTSEVPGEFR